MAIKVPKDREVPFGAITPAPVGQQDLFITSNWRIVRPVIDHEKCTRCFTCYACLSGFLLVLQRKGRKDGMELEVLQRLPDLHPRMPSGCPERCRRARLRGWRGSSGKTFLSRRKDYGKRINAQRLRRSSTGCKICRSGGHLLLPDPSLYGDHDGALPRWSPTASWMPNSSTAKASTPRSPSCLGASAAGARAYTGSSGVGVTYAFEVYSPAAGGRYPLQMAIADRTLDPPGDFGSEHTDAMSARDQGWLMGWACDPAGGLRQHLDQLPRGRGPRGSCCPSSSARTGISSPISRTRSSCPTWPR